MLIPKLMLVARRVKDWVEPLLYRTMAVDYGPILVEYRPIAHRGRPKYTANAILSAIRAKPPAFFHRAVRHLALFASNADEKSAADSETILGVCTGTENLSMLHIPEAWIPLIASLPLKHLYAEYEPLLRVLPPTHAFFSRLTHLELNSSSVDDEMACVALAALPQLTHLSFGHSEAVPIFPRLLQSCLLLRVLVCLHWAPSLGVHAELARDVRFVVMMCTYYIEDWYMGVEHGADYWSRAENLYCQAPGA